MIGHTKALTKAKEEQQKVLDFSVLVCHAVPNLSKMIKGVEMKIPKYGLAKPYYYKDNETLDRLKSISKDYQINISKYILLSNYSYLETYFQEVVDELVTFHGGKEQFLKSNRDNIRKHLDLNDVNVKKHKAKLQEPLVPRNSDKYRNNLQELEKIAEYRNPSELFSSYGLKQFIETVKSTSFKSSMIPDLLEFALNFDMTEKINRHGDLLDKNLRETFEVTRDIRNKIAHGKCKKISFEKVLDLARFIRYFEVKIDKHLVENFFILERYK